MKRAYEFYVDLLMQRHTKDPSRSYDAEALRASERGRARSLTEMLNEAHVDIRQGVDAALIERERNLTQLLNAKAQRQIQLLAQKAARMNLRLSNGKSGLSKTITNKCWLQSVRQVPNTQHLPSLNRSTPSDTGERLIVHEGSDDVEWLPERISASTRLAEGDRLRIAVEAARSGYLYVIDREQYTDGSLGEPYLIFPTTRTLSGDNSVKRGKLIEIPAQDDGPPYFRMRRSRPDHVAEVLSIFVTPTPVDGLTITDKAQKLSEAQVVTWEKEWSA